MLFDPLVTPEIAADQSFDVAGGETSPAATESASPVDARLRLCVLGSGSGGNCSVIHHGNEAILIDAGFGPLTIARRLRQAGSDLSSIRAICLTHLDQDHFRPNLIKTLLGWSIAVCVHRWHRDHLMRHEGATELGAAGLIRTFDAPFEILPNLHITPIPLPHDQKGTLGFVIDGGAGRIGYATDLGHVPPQMIDRFSEQGGVSVLAIESNYDPLMQRNSSRPAYLKQRIMGGQGHLSNQQCFEAVSRICRKSAGGQPHHIVLLHRSSQCNCPQVVQQVFNQDPAMGGRVKMTEQRRRSRWFHVEAVRQVRATQMGLFG